MGSWIRRLREGFDRFAVDVMLLGVGSIATYLSVKYTYGWHVYTGDPTLEALGFSLVVVGFAVLIFEFAVKAVIDKQRRATVFFLMWFAVAAYSMQTTVAGQYIGVKTKEIARLEENVGAQTATVQVEALRRKLEPLDKLDEVDERRESQLLEILEKIDSVEKRYEWKNNVGDTEAELRAIVERRTARLLERAAIEEEIREYEVLAKVEELKGNGTNVFAFYSDVLGIEDTTRVEFWLAVFRGVILDTVNILCFMFVMLRRKERDEKPKRRLAEVSPEEGQLGPTDEGAETSPMDKLVDLAFSEARRNHTFPGLRVSRSVGVSDQEYRALLEWGLYAGLLTRKKGVYYLNKEVGKEEFKREVKER